MGKLFRLLVWKWPSLDPENTHINKKMSTIPLKLQVLNLCSETHLQGGKHTRSHRHTHQRTHTHTDTRTNIHTLGCKYTHTHTHTHKQIQTYAHTYYTQTQTTLHSHTHVYIRHTQIEYTHRDKFTQHTDLWYSFNSWTTHSITVTNWRWTDGDTAIAAHCRTSFNPVKIWLDSCERGRKSISDWGGVSAEPCLLVTPARGRVEPYDRGDTKVNFCMFSWNLQR